MDLISNEQKSTSTFQIIWNKILISAALKCVQTVLIALYVATMAGKKFSRITLLNTEKSQAFSAHKEPSLQCEIPPIKIFFFKRISLLILIIFTRKCTVRILHNATVNAIYHHKIFTKKLIYNCKICKCKSHKPSQNFQPNCYESVSAYG